MHITSKFVEPCVSIPTLLKQISYKIFLTETDKISCLSEPKPFLYLFHFIFSESLFLWQLLHQKLL